MSGLADLPTSRSPIRRAFRAAPHLVLLAGVVLLSAFGLGAGSLYVRGEVRRSIYGLAPTLPKAKVLGVGMIREAFRHPDLMPAFGSSELVRRRLFYGPTFFRDAPTGFHLFPVAQLGATPLSTLLRVAAAGPAIRGKKLVVSFTPGFFLSPSTDRFDAAYVGNFSPLQANTLAFSTDLSPGLSRDLAAELLKHGATLRNEPLLHAALEARAGTTIWDHARFLGLYPLGQVEQTFYRLADDFMAWRALVNQPEVRAPVTRAPAAPDWSALADSADRVSRARAGDSPFAIERGFFERHGKYFLRQKDKAVPERWLVRMRSAYGWPGLDLLLRLLQERGAKPLIVTMPQHGAFDDYVGLRAGVRLAYYDRFRAAVAPYGFPVETFQRYDADTFFLNDPDNHPSPRGWLIYDRVLDAFYHDTLR